MVEEYVMQDHDFPEIEQKLENDKQKGCYEQAMRDMVNQNPKMFAGEKWNKWRNKPEEEMLCEDEGLNGES
jgi:hypothetical protein